MKQLIVTVDDFGYSKYTNRAIIKCFREGMVTSISLIVNTRYFNESIKILKQNKNLDVGIHINLTEFTSLTNPKTLIGKNGNFIDKAKWFNGYYKHADKSEIEDEIEAQILKVLSSGLKITHINGHNHIHIFPKVIDAVTELTKKYRINCIRIPHESGIKSLIYEFSKTARTKISKSNLKTTDAFYGIFNMHNMNFGNLSKILISIKDGTSELMMHPAYVDIKGDSFHQSIQREKEIKLLTNNQIKNLIKKQNIQLINFSQI